jgi:hypothetical protein
MLAVAFANVAQAEKKYPLLEVPEALGHAKRNAQDLARFVALELESELAYQKRRRPDEGRDRALTEFLEALEPIVLLLLAGTIRRWRSRTSPTNGPVEDRRSLIEGLERNALRDDDVIEYVQGLRLDYRAQYNLACYYAGVGDDERRNPSKPKEPRTSEGDDEATTSSGDDAEKSETPKYKPPTGYVRAFSALAEALKTAPFDLVEWAEDDPSLEGLRGDKELGPRFKSLIKELTPAKEEPKKIPGSPMNAKPD